MPVRFLSDAQREQLSGFPAELEPESACDEDWCRPSLTDTPAVLSPLSPLAVPLLLKPRAPVTGSAPASAVSVLFRSRGASSPARYSRNPRRCATRVNRSSNRAAYPSSGPGAGGHDFGLVITGLQTHRETHYSNPTRFSLELTNYR